MRRNKVIDGTAIVIAAGSLTFLAWLLLPFPPRPDSRPHRAAGLALATEALARRAPNGRITVITRDTSEFPQPALTILLKSFEKALRAQGARIDGTLALDVDPLRLADVPSGDFLRLIRKEAPGSVIVSLLGPPTLTEEERQWAGSKRPAVIAFCPGNMASQVDLRRVFEQRLLDAAIIDAPPTSGRSSGDSEPATSAFVVLTPTNVAAHYEIRAR